jgi:hypothetical protein
MSVPTLDPTIEQVAEWCRGLRYTEEDLSYERMIAMQAAQWGADQELEACLDQLQRWGIQGVDNLRNTRRPKPPSLKEQALEVVTGLQKRVDLQCDLSLLRRALEQLDD